MFEFVLILYLLYYWQLTGVTLVLASAREKTKKQQLKLVTKELKLFRNILGHFYDSHEEKKNIYIYIHHINFV